MADEDDDFPPGGFGGGMIASRRAAVERAQTVTDAFFALGRENRPMPSGVNERVGPVCQDYALAVPGEVWLSDGCSSSPHTDFGARLLCRMAVVHGFSGAAEYARPLLTSLNLPPESLDATLLMARRTRTNIWVFVRGDGVVVARRRDGTHVTIVIEYPSGAPLYPNYDLDLDRLARYEAQFGTRKVVTRQDGQKREVHEETAHDHPRCISDFIFPVDEYNLVLIMSDGASTFRRPVAGQQGLTESVPLETVVEEMLAIKSFGGEFIHRRAKRFLASAAANGWHHEDDFSVAGLHILDDKKE